MALFDQDETFTATEVVRNFSSIIKSISNGEKKKIFVVKNSKLEAVIMSMSDYEKMNDAVKILEKIYSAKKSKNAD